MIMPFERTGALDRQKVLGVFDDTNRFLIARGVAAHEAYFGVAQIIAHAAEHEPLFEVNDAFGERAGLFFAVVEQPKGDTLSAPAANARKLAHTLDQLFD